MSHLKEKRPVDGGTFFGGNLAADNENSTENLTTFNPHLSSLNRRRLSAQAGALLKLDYVEQRLKAARDSGDDSTWVRFYQSWLKLHPVAFGYGKFSGEAGR